MGNIISGSDFTGSVGPITVFKMRGHDKLVIRSKGGASKRKIKTHPNFDATRKLNREWVLVTSVASNIRKRLGGIRQLSDYNISGPLNALIKKIQTADSVNEKGKRSILFSRYPEYLTTFQFNRQTLFDSIVRQQPEINIDKTAGVASVTIPLLQPNIHFFPNPKYAYYRFVIDMASESDHVWNEQTNSYNGVASQLPIYKLFNTDWFPTSGTRPAATYQMIPFYENFLTGPDMILILGVGIQYGMPAP
ncbi:MAG TPA: hypothetical protein VHT72_05620, partial [Puia sp.]|nr:hypothetical protein [Puia sp.]